MGRFGSSRWQGYLKKTTVEACLTLDVNALCRLIPLLWSALRPWPDRGATPQARFCGGPAGAVDLSLTRAVHRRPGGHSTASGGCHPARLRGLPLV